MTRIVRRKGSVVVGDHGEGDNLSQLNWSTDLLVYAQSTLDISEYNNHRVVKWTKGVPTGIVVRVEEDEDLTQWSSPT